MGMSEIFFRIRLTRDRKLRFKSGVFIKASPFKDGEIVKPRANQKEIAALRQVENDLAALEGRILAFLLTVNPAKVPREAIGERA